METKNIKIGIITIATGDQYVTLANRLLKSIDTYFCNDCVKMQCVITDQPHKFSDLETHTIINLPSPLITLLRFKFFNDIKHIFNNCNYVYYIDADCEVVQSVNLTDIIPDIQDQFIVTRHPWANSSDNTWLLENNQKSEAYIDNVKDYFQGSFYGASNKLFFTMADTLHYQVSIDLKNKIISRWFDESYFNKYMFDKNYKILSAELYAQPTKHGILPHTKIHHQNAYSC